MDRNPPKVAETDIQLNPDALVALENYCAAVVAGKLADQMEDLDRETLLAAVLHSFVNKWVETGVQPPNPILATDNAQCRFQFKRGMRVALPKEAANVLDALRLAGIHHARRKRFARHTRRRTQTSLSVSLTELQKHPDSAVARHADKLQRALEGCDDDLLVREKVTELKDEEKFLSSLPSLVLSAEEMLKVLRVFVPTIAFSDVAHGDALAAVEIRAKKLQVYEDDRRQVKSILDGRHVHLYRRTGRQWRKVGVKPHKLVKDARKFAKEAVASRRDFTAAVESLK